jgi:hypothetical protein
MKLQVRTSRSLQWMVLVLVACAVGCRPRTGIVPPDHDPTTVRVHSFACNEVRLDVIPNSATSLSIQVGHDSEMVDLRPFKAREVRLIFKTMKNGILVTGADGLVRKEFVGLSDVVFLTPPFDDGRTVVLGTCQGENGSQRAIRLEMHGPTGDLHCKMPPITSTPFDLQQYKLNNLPAVRDMADAITEIREKENNRDYDFFTLHRKPAGGNFKSEAYWGLTMWPRNAQDCVTYMSVVGLPSNRHSIWQVFVIDPETQQVSLIRDRQTGALIPLNEWLELENKTAVYSLEEMLAGISDNYMKNRISEQDGADQPATAPESKSEGKKKPNPESKVRPQ